MGNDEPRGKFRLNLDDPVTRRRWENIQSTKREIEQWPSWKRGETEAGEQDRMVNDFHTRWSAFMEGGWGDLVRNESEKVEAARRRADELIPTHPATIKVSELVARIVDIEKVAKEEHLFAALLLMSNHNHAVFAAGWVYRPSPRVPRRGNCLEDMFLLFGYAMAIEPPKQGG